MSAIKNMIILGEDMSGDDNEKENAAYLRRKNNMLNEQYEGEKKGVIVGDAEDAPDVEDVKESVKGTKVSRDAVIVYDSHASDRSKKENGQKVKGQFKRYETQGFLNATAREITKNLEPSSEENQGKKPLMAVVTCHGGVACKPPNVELDFVAFSSRSYESSMEHGDKKIETILNKKGEEKSNFEKIGEIALSSAETIYVNLEEKEASDPKIAESKKLTGPKPINKEEDKSQEKYEEMSNDYLRDHLSSKIEKLADIMGVDKNSKEYHNLKGNINDKTIEKYRNSVFETATERKDTARAMAAYDSGVTYKKGKDLNPAEVAMANCDYATAKSLVDTGKEMLSKDDTDILNKKKKSDSGSYLSSAKEVGSLLKNSGVTNIKESNNDSKDPDKSGLNPIEQDKNRSI